MKENYIGINPENIDKTVDPNFNFYDYSNGTWLKNNPVPPEFSRWGTWNQVIERNNEILKQILEGASTNRSASAGSYLQKLGDLYFTAMDTVTIEKEGMNPVKDDLAKIDAIQSKDDFQKVFSYLKSFRNGGIFFFFAAQDDKNSQNVILQLFQGGLGLPDRDYYLKDDEKSKKLKDQYGEFILKMFALMGNDEMTSANIARKILDIETRLAKSSMTRLEMRDPEAMYHLMKLNELKSLTPNFNWDVLLNEIGLSQDSKFDKGVIVAQPEFFKEVDRMINDVSIDDWKNYLKWNLVRWAADKLSSDFENVNFDFYSKALRGTQQQQSRWKQSVEFAGNAMGEPLGQIFVEKYFTPETKAKAMEMVNNIKNEFGERLKNNEWMSETTKKEALKKLSTFKVKIGYTDDWKDYSGLEIDRSSFYNNMKRAAIYNMKLNLDKIGMPVNPDEWGMTPQTVNASYNSSKNDITFPAGIMQPPFYDPNADDAVNYGAIGAIIGHELTHGFDDQGRLYDGDGNLRDWWTEADAKNFKARADKLAAQFSRYLVIDTMHVKGELTLGENIADLGGMVTSYYALQKSLEGKEKKIIDGFTPEQRFFLGFSQIWRNNSRPEALRLQVNTDPHSPGKFRVIGTISNMEEFMKAFNGKPGDPMVRDAGERVVIW
ncbi:MAG: M13 family metallopeptidase [Bacteroidota bacterium]|nr:M13 family metallopeptidase [Bacteroidota bacterium]